MNLDELMTRIPWRMSLIFLPALLNGQWQNMSFYSPFLFGQVLSSCRAEMFHLTDERSVRLQTGWVAMQVAGFWLFSQYYDATGRYLSSFFFSSFLCPVPPRPAQA